MYITENDLKRRLLTAKIEVLEDILNEVRRVQEREIIKKNSKGVDMLTRLYQPYTDYRTTLISEREKLKG